MAYEIIEKVTLNNKENKYIKVIKYAILEKDGNFYVQLKLKNTSEYLLKKFDIVYSSDGEEKVYHEEKIEVKPGEVFYEKKLISIPGEDFDFIGFKGVSGKKYVEEVKEEKYEDEEEYEDYKPTKKGPIKLEKGPWKGFVIAFLIFTAIFYVVGLLMTIGEISEDAYMIILLSSLAGMIVVALASLIFVKGKDTNPGITLGFGISLILVWVSQTIVNDGHAEEFSFFIIRTLVLFGLGIGCIIKARKADKKELRIKKKGVFLSLLTTLSMILSSYIYLIGYLEMEFGIGKNGKVEPPSSGISPSEGPWQPQQGFSFKKHGCEYYIDESGTISLENINEFSGGHLYVDDTEYGKVDIIRSGAIANNDEITGLRLDNFVGEIEDDAIYNCPNLTEIYFGEMNNLTDTIFGDIISPVTNLLFCKTISIFDSFNGDKFANLFNIVFRDNAYVTNSFNLINTHSTIYSKGELHLYGENFCDCGDIDKVTYVRDNLFDHDTQSFKGINKSARFFSIEEINGEEIIYEQKHYYQGSFLTFNKEGLVYRHYSHADGDYMFCNGFNQNSYSSDIVVPTYVEKNGAFDVLGIEPFAFAYNQSINKVDLSNVIDGFIIDTYAFSRSEINCLIVKENIMIDPTAFANSFVGCVVYPDGMDITSLQESVIAENYIPYSEYEGGGY